MYCCNEMTWILCIWSVSDQSLSDLAARCQLHHDEQKWDGPKERFRHKSISRLLNQISQVIIKAAKAWTCGRTIGAAKVPVVFLHWRLTHFSSRFLANARNSCLVCVNQKIQNFFHTWQDRSGFVNTKVNQTATTIFEVHLFPLCPCTIRPDFCDRSPRECGGRL